MSDCIFCKISRGEIPADVVYEDEHCLAFRDIQPKAPIHLLLIPRKHIENLGDLTDDDGELMAHMMLVINRIALQQGLQEGYRTVTNTGTGGGQEVYHLHFHILGGGTVSAL